MAIHSVYLPMRFAFGASVKIERRTRITRLGNGAEYRQTSWAHARRRYDIGGAVQSHDDLAELIAFFEARQGSLNGFLWRDPLDCKSCAPSKTPGPLDQHIAMGDNATRVFALAKRYGSADMAYLRPVQHPVESSVRIALNGRELEPEADFTLAPGGLVELNQPLGIGEELRAGFTFDLPVRFDCEALDITLSHPKAGVAPSVPIVEIIG